MADNQKDYKDLGRGSAWLFIALFLSRFLGLIFTIIIARLYSQSEIGLYYLAFSAVGLFTIFTDFGIASTLQTYASYYYGKNDYERLRKLTHITFAIGIASSIILILLFIIFAQSVAVFFKNTALTPLLQIFAIYFMLNVLFTLSQSFMLCFRLAKESSFSQNMQIISRLLLLFLVPILFGNTATSLSILFVVSFGLGTFLSLYYFFKLYKKLPKDETGITYNSIFLEAAPFALAVMGTGIAGTIFGNIDDLLLGLLADPSVSARFITIYSISLGFGTFLQVFSSAIGGIFIPIIANMHGKNEADFSKINSLTNSSTKWSFLATGPLFILLFLFPGESLIALYGKDFSTGGLTLFFIVLGFLWFTLGYSQRNLFSALKKGGLSFKIFVTSLMVNLISNVILIPRFGIEGAGFSFMLFYFTAFILAHYYSKKLFNFTFSSWVFKYFAFFIVLFLVLWSVRLPVFEYSGQFISLFIQSTSGGTKDIHQILTLGVIFFFVIIVYLVGIVLLRLLHKDERELLISFFQKINAPGSLIAFVAKLPTEEEEKTA